MVVKCDAIANATVIATSVSAPSAICPMSMRRANAIMTRSKQYATFRNNAIIIIIINVKSNNNAIHLMVTT